MGNFRPIRAYPGAKRTVFRVSRASAGSCPQGIRATTGSYPQVRYSGKCRCYQPSIEGKPLATEALTYSGKRRYTVTSAYSGKNWHRTCPYSGKCRVRRATYSGKHRCQSSLPPVEGRGSPGARGIRADAGTDWMLFGQRPVMIPHPIRADTGFRCSVADTERAGSRVSTNMTTLMTT